MTTYHIETYKNIKNTSGMMVCDYHLASQTFVSSLKCFSRELRLFEGERTHDEGRVGTVWMNLCFLANPKDVTLRQPIYLLYYKHPQQSLV